MMIVRGMLRRIGTMFGVHDNRVGGTEKSNVQYELEGVGCTEHFMCIRCGPVCASFGT